MKQLVWLYMLLLTIQAGAVPAMSVRKLVKMEDGTEVMVTLKGDEHFCYYDTDDGKHLTRLPSGAFRRMHEDEFKASLAQAQAQTTNDDRRRTHRLQTNKASAIKGNKKGLVILAQFQDVKFTAKSPRTFYDDFFNKEGFDEGGNTGSVHDFFYDQSYGQFNLTFDVVGPVTLPNNTAYYGAHGTNDFGQQSTDIRAMQFAYDACLAAKNLTDFSQYDWDNDGAVDQVFIIFAGYSEAQGASEDCIWPHEWILYSDKYKLEFNGKRIYTYGCSSELRGAKGIEADGIGTACHEFSHCLGLMDHYDTNGQKNFGMGHWDVMDAGSYLGAPSSTSPMGYTSYERWQSGWLDPIEIKDKLQVKDMPALEHKPQAYLLRNDGFDNEYYLLENRQPTKWGKDINAHGLMVLHVDYNHDVWESNAINQTANHQRMTYLAADGVYSKNNYGGDPYPGTSGNTSVSNASAPAAKVYNRNTDGSYFLNKPIQSITESKEGLISFNACYELAPTPAHLTAQQTGQNLTINWDAVPEATQYRIYINEIPNKLAPQESLVFQETFKNVPIKNGTSDIGEQLDQYCDNPDWFGDYIYTSKNGGLTIGSSFQTGALCSPAYRVPRTNESTILIEAGPRTDGRTVNGVLYVMPDAGETVGTRFTVNQRDTLLFTPKVISNQDTYILLDDLDKQLCIYSVEVYDGTFSFDEISSSKATEVKALSAPKHKARASHNLTSETTSTTFGPLQDNCSYSIQVQAIMDDGRLSDWSNEVVVNVEDATDIVLIKASGTDSPKIVSGTFDFTGRRVSNPTAPGLYIVNGKKVLVK